MRLGVLAVLATLLAAVPAAAQDPPYAPLDQPPPRLQGPADELSDSLSCTGDLAGAPGEPILLVHGTALTPDQFDWTPASVRPPSTSRPRAPGSSRP